MKKAINVNLGGLIFHIDEDAYDKLKHYLATLTNQFGNNAEAREIVSDIESRIAELLQSRINAGKQVINISDIEEIITILGKPSEFDGEAEPTTEKSYTNTETIGTPRRRFYRDTDNSIIGGVCSGIGAYFNIDPVIIRILFVVFFFIGGSTLLIYLILWIALPAAKTAAQKLEMRGEPINVSNIEKTVKDEYERIRKNINEIDPARKTRNFFESVAHFVVTLVKGILKAVAIFVGVIFTIVGVALILAIVAIVFGHSGSLHTNGFQFSDIPFFINQLGGAGMKTLAVAAVIMVVAIPVLALLFFGLKLIFKFKIQNRVIWLSALGLWIASIVTIGMVAFSTGKKLTDEGFKSTSFQIQTKPYNTVYLKMNEENTDNIKELLSVGDDVEYYTNKNKDILGRPHISIELSNDSSASILIERKAQGASSENADFNAYSIQYDVFQKDSVLLADAYFSSTKEINWRAQRIDVKIYLPKGVKLSIDKNMGDILKDANINGNYWIHELPGKTWLMTEKGLEEQK